MRFQKQEMKVSLLSIAVFGALAAMCAAPMMAQAADPTDDEVALIRKPTNYVEIGGELVSASSQRFGAYNGLNKGAGSVVGNFSLSGGDAYQAGDGTQRWNITGTDLGTTSREFGATVGNQGKWNFGFGYDELRHNLADGYQTPYNGDMGGNNFTLPANFTAVNVTSPAVGTRALSGAQRSDFHTMDIGTTRKNTSLTAGFIIDPRWDIKFDFNHLDQSGAKLMSFGSDAVGGVNKGQGVTMLPNPTNYKTDTVNLGLNWMGDKAHMTLSYFGSFFRDGYDRVTWSTWDNGLGIDTMTTAPNNTFNQINLTGGLSLAPKTSLAGGLSYARNTQNAAFVPTGLTITNNGVGSLNGEVINTHADAKLTDKSIKDLVLSAGIKYDNRDNRTPSNIYNFNSIDGGNAAKYPNTPLSIKKTQWEVAGDYRLDKAQNIRLAYNFDDTRRGCEQYAVNAGYPAGTNCVVATGAKENKASLGYRIKASDDLNLNAAYSYGKRTTDSDTKAIAAFKTIQNGLPAGTNASDFLGFHPYLDENRTQQMLKMGVNWQANEQLSLGVTGKYAKDIYDTLYGWKNGSQWSLNLDATYSYSEKGSISSYVTQQSRARFRTDLQALVGAASNSATKLSTVNNSTDSGNLRDTDFTFGLAFKQGGLMGGKLDLVGDLSYSLSKTIYDTTLNWAGVTTDGSTCASATILACGQVPVIRNSLTQFKLTGTYQVDKASKISVGYLFQRLVSDDYYYNGLQTGFTPTALMPTNMSSGSYSINVVSASYIYSFK